MCSAQKHFLWTMSGPFSSYSSLEIHSCDATASDASIEPPSHAPCTRSGTAQTAGEHGVGARRPRSSVSRAGRPGIIDEPPASTTDAYQLSVPSLPCSDDSRAPSLSRRRMASATSCPRPPECSPTIVGLKSLVKRESNGRGV